MNALSSSFAAEGVLAEAVEAQADVLSVTIPDAQFLFHADFKRTGPDLTLTGDDGHRVIVPNYFDHEKLPTLLSAEGAALTGDLVAALAGPLAPGQYAQAGALSAGAPPIGRVASVTGNVVAVRNGVAVTLNVGDAVLKGDVIQTSADSGAGIYFNDGTTFNMTANARMVLNDFVYNPAPGSTNSALINLVQGSFTFLAGEVAHTGDMRVSTPAAVMGIRGTAVQVDIDVNNGQTKLSVLVEPNGNVGSFNIFSLSGQLLGTVTNADNVTTVTPAGPLQAIATETQKTPAEIAQSLALVQQVFQTQAFGQTLTNPTGPANPNNQNNPTTPNPNPDSSPNTHGSTTPPDQILTNKIVVTVNDNAAGVPTTTVDVVPLPPVPPVVIINQQVPQTLPVLPPPPQGSPPAAQHAVESSSGGAGTGTASSPVPPPTPSGTYNTEGWTSIGDGNFTKSGTYGTATLNTNTNTVTYTLDNVKADALRATDVVQDTFVVSFTDGATGDTTSTDVNFVVEGRNDAPRFNTTPDLSFETGLEGWHVLGAAAQLAGGTQGASAAQLESGQETVASLESFLGLAAGTLAAINGSGSDDIPTLGSAIEKDFVLHAGDTVTFDWRFDTTDYSPFRDFAFFSVSGAGEAEVVKLSDVLVVGDYNSSGWQTTTFTATADGTYHFGFGVLDAGDNGLPSSLLVDNISVSTSSLSVTTGASASGTETISRDIGFSDPEVADTHTVSGPFFVSSDYGVSEAHPNGVELGSLSALLADLHSNQVTVTYTVADADIAFLASGTEIHQVYNFVVSDELGASSVETIAVTIVGANDPPVLTLPGSAVSTGGGASLMLTGAHLADSTPGDVITLTLSVDHGTLTANGPAPAGAVFDDADGSDGTLQVHGSAAVIDTLLDSGVTYAPGGDFSGSATLTVTAQDLAGGSDTKHVAIAVEGHAPVIAPGTVSSGDIHAVANSDLGSPFTAQAAAYLTAGHALIDGLGGPSGFGENVALAGDDNSTGPIALTSVFGEDGLNLFGTTYHWLYINNNGNVTFAGPTGAFTPSAITGGVANPIIAPFWADVDTRGGSTLHDTDGTSDGANRVFYDYDVPNHVLTITWDDVGYYGSHSDKANAFQLQLIGLDNADFDIVFRYEDIAWTTGDASGGFNGLGGQRARAGYSDGEGHSFELPQSGTDAMLDLDSIDGNTGIPGVYVFLSHAGEVSTGQLSTAGVIDFSDADLSDVHTASWDYQGSDTPLGTFTLVKTSDTTGIGTGGQFDWTYSVDPSALQYLTADETRQEVFQVTIADDHGGHVVQDVTVTLHGVNDAPETQTDNFIASVDVVSGDNPIEIPGDLFTGNDSDADGDAFEIVSADDSASHGSVEVQEGNIVYHNDPDFVPPGEGESATDRFLYTVRDSHGAESTALATLAVQGGSSLAGTAGRDIIVAGAEGHAMTGLGGEDVFVFLGGHSAVTDFDQGNTGSFDHAEGDRIDLLGVSDITTEQLQGLLDHAAGDTIDFGGGNSLTFNAAVVSHLTTADFIIHHQSLA